MCKEEEERSKSETRKHIFRGSEMIPGFEIKEENTTKKEK